MSRRAAPASIPSVIYEAMRAAVRSLVGSGPGPIYGVIFTMAADPTRIIKFASVELKLWLFRYDVCKSGWLQYVVWERST